jgi:3-hydroxypropanoate dehydrogenase
MKMANQMRNQSEPRSLAAVKTPISREALDQLFSEARTHSAWLPEPVSVELLRKAYELARLGPTSANGSPARFVFVTTTGAKTLLKPALAPGNVDKTMAAPVTVIIAWDTEFHEHLPRLFPQADMRSYFVGNKPLTEENAFRNSSLQAGYFILAARALGLDCGPMSGFDAAKLNAAFFPDGKWKVNLLCNLGYGDPSKLHPRNPRLNFEEVAVIL